MIRLSPQKLRLFFIGFFLALAIPSSILSWKSYEQLKWEIFYQYQLDAQFLTQQINSNLENAIAKEEERAATDYTFLVLAGNPQAKFVQRSDLSKFPVESDLPGLVGYFQVDEKGQFSSPLLPLVSNQSALYGISAEEQLQRSQLVHRVKNILSKNHLVSIDSRTEQTTPDRNRSVLADDNSGGDSSGIVIVGNRSSTNSSSVSNDAEEMEADALAESVAASESPGENLPETLQALRQPNNDYSQQNSDGFNKLLSKKKQKAAEDLVLRQSSEKRSGISMEQKKEDQSNNKIASKSAFPRTNRLEQNYSPQQLVAPSISPQAALTRDDIEINLFESEIEPFNVSLLSSRHLVAYRQVWRDKQRIIQGAILDSREFYRLAINTAFESSNMPSVATLSVAYGRKILETFDGSNSLSRGSYRSKRLVGEKLFSAPLSAPFNDISLSFNIREMPAGKGAGFIVMVTFSLMVVLILGTYLLYRLTLKQSMLAQQQQDFVSSVSHELKTPLTSIRMYGEILRQGWMTEEKKKEYYDYIYQESERLSRLIGNVLQISKVNRNSLELEIKPVSISELVSLIHSKVDSQVDQSDFSLTIQGLETVGDSKVAVDLDAFIQIMINLVDNAIKYSAKAQRKEIIIEFKSDKKQRINVSVRDFGPGIAKEQLTKIFNLFYRSGNELTRECAGTGIGLALVKQLAEAMDMKVSAVSRSIGAEFVLIIKSHSEN